MCRFYPVLPYECCGQRGLSAFSALDERPLSGTLPVPTSDRGGGGKPECAGARDDEYRYEAREESKSFPASPQPIPAKMAMMMTMGTK